MAASWTWAFVVVTEPARDEAISQRLVEGFDEGIKEFYDAADVERGGIEIENRSGKLENFPIMSITVALVSGDKSEFPSTHVIAERAAELKKYLKRFAGSNFLSERRRQATVQAQAGVDRAG